MNWRLWARKDIAGFTAVIAFFVGVFVFYAFTNSSTRQANPLDFGPEWTCINAGQGDPVCTKKTGPSN